MVVKLDKYFVWTFVIGFFVLILGFWLLFSSILLSGFPQIISLRRSYLEVFIPKIIGVTPGEAFRFNKNWLPFTFITRQKKVLDDNSVSYVHCFLGKYKKLNLNNAELVLGSKYGGEYKFKVSIQMIPDDSNKFSLLYNYAGQNYSLNNDVAIFGEGVEPFAKDETFKVCWDDSRSLSEIFFSKEYRLSKTVNINSDQIFEITRYVED